MAKLRPFRDYSEHDVINLFAYNGTSLTRGAIVKLDSTTGWKADQNFSTESMALVTLSVNDMRSRQESPFRIAETLPCWVWPFTTLLK